MFIQPNVLENNHTRPGADRFFNGHGAYIDTLNVQLNLTENTSVLGGKFAPSFGTAWDVAPGIYGTDFAEDYELSEQLGFAIGHNFGTDSIGTILLTGNIFTADTTFMSNSVGAVRGRAEKIDGGAGNTEELNNYSVTLDLGDIKSVEGLSVHLGYRHLAKGVDSSNAENGYVAGFVYETHLSEELSAALTGEFTHLSHAGGGADDQNFFTAGVSFGYGQWHLDVAGTQRNTDVAGGADVKDELFQISLGYTDAYETDWNIGYKFSEEGGVDTEFFGVFVTKTFGFEG